jgi:fructokinase
MTSDNAPIVVGLGEALWDCFPNERRPGGAPANVAYHASQLGLRGVVCTRVGRDALGDELLEFLRDHRLSVDHVQRDPRRPTGRVDIEISDAEPSYTFADDVAWDHLDASDDWRALMASARAICFGTLAQRAAPSREAIAQCLAAAREETLVVYDVNLREPWYDARSIANSLRAAAVVKLNQHEVEVLSSLLEFDGPAVRGDPPMFAEALRRDYGVRLVCVTRGADGSWLDDGQSSVDHPGVAVADPHPVGAGDAFTAGLIFSLLSQWPLARSANFASQVAACVVRHEGAMPDVADDYQRLIEEFDLPGPGRS